MRFGLGQVSLILLFMHSAAWAQGPSVAEWGLALPLDQRIYQELARYSYEGKKLRSGYMQKFVQRMRERTLGRVERRVSGFLSSPCQPEVNVEFMRPGFLWTQEEAAELSRAEAQFESGLVQVASVGCFSNGTIQDAASIYMDRDYRLQTIPFLAETFGNSAGETCERTEAPWYAPVNHVSYCMSHSTYSTENVLSLYFRVVSNVPSFEPVYFRENLLTFVQTPWGIVWYMLGFARGEEIGGITKDFVEWKLPGYQEDAIEEMRRRLSK